MLISIIVPVYNIERYISRCIDSIINQTYRDLQLILVDDGSTDSSGELCDIYASKDKRIKVIHKKNGGVSEARNVGLENAEGDFIGFVDGDDYIDVDMYETLYKAILQKRADIVSCGHYEHFADRIEVRYCNTGNNALNRIEAYNALFTRKLGCSNCTKLFKRYIFDSLRYNNKKSHGEDLEILLKAFEKAKCVVNINDAKYHYAHRKGSATDSLLYVSNMSIIPVLEENIPHICKKYPQVRMQAYAYEAMWLINDLNVIYNAVNRKECKNDIVYIKRRIRVHFKRYWKNSYIYIGDYILLWGVVLHAFSPFKWWLNISVRIYHSLKGCADKK